MGQQKLVVKIMTMSDEKTKQKAMEAVADIHGVDSIAADIKEQKMIILGEMDSIAVAKKLKKVGKIDIISVGPANQEKKEEKKEEKKDEKAVDKK
ncbi:heavy metal-associated isoprenylated plant protein 39-like [Nicotiana tabacum]|uniref:Heavy metal-associated isoprenylated plant protein 39-like n=1 Tax=Nicotiana tabacum TaxID=4097 RepID=A0A1S4DCR4_TOBAC|nr:PREDICTED: uncharacterized protein LOC107828414 [Nicotiana tabacum]